MISRLRVSSPSSCLGGLGCVLGCTVREQGHQSRAAGRRRRLEWERSADMVIFASIQLAQEENRDGCHEDVRINSYLLVRFAAGVDCASLYKTGLCRITKSHWSTITCKSSTCAFLALLRVRYQSFLPSWFFLSVYAFPRLAVHSIVEWQLATGKHGRQTISDMMRSSI